MPLNIKENGTSEVSGEERPKPQPQPQPILHQPKVEREGISKILIGLFVLVVGISIVFLLYQYKLINWNGATERSQVSDAAPNTSGEMQSIAADPPVVQPQEQKQESVVMGGIVTPPMGAGKYTIFISAYKSREDAAAEVARWTAAGFPSFVHDASSWYRVALGRFEGVREARAEAESLKEAFENGYWIGNVQ